MNTVAILCPGPSLALFDGRENYDLTIGVNRAAIKTGVDVWACGDYPLLLEIQREVIGSPTLYTAAGSAAHIRDHAEPWRGPVEEFESLYDGSQNSYQWTMYTATAALWYATARGATTIRGFGMDWKGEADFDGWAKAGNRRESRWENEKLLWTNIAGVLKQRGIAVERITQ